MKKIVISILMFVWIMALGAENAPVFVYEVFYKEQSYSQLKKSLAELNKLWNQKKSEEKEKQFHIETIFLAQVLKKHPEFLSLLASEFPQMTFHEKSVFLRAVKSAEIDLDLLKTISDEKLKALLYDPKLPLVGHLQDSPLFLDYLWTSFFATGNVSFIRKIYQTASHCDDQLLALGYIWKQHETIAAIASSWRKQPPDFTPLNNLLEEFSLEKKDAAKQLFDIILPTMWTVDLYTHRNPHLEEVIKKLLQEDPSLNCERRITVAMEEINQKFKANTPTSKRQKIK
jgi:hypothetical protein